MPLKVSPHSNLNQQAQTSQLDKQINQKQDQLQSENQALYQLNNLQVVQQLTDHWQLIRDPFHVGYEFGNDGQDLLKERVQLNNEFDQEAFQIDAVGDVEQLGKLGNNLEKKRDK